MRRFIMEDFQDFGLPDALLQKLEHLKFTSPTPIQFKAIPIALRGLDILGSAQTGTGKTVAFGIPAITRLLTSKEGSVLVVTPTRELAAQVHQALADLLPKDSKIRSVLLIGGDPIYKQLQKLKSKPRLIVATPGRLNDHLRNRSVDLSQTKYLVLDETDRMLDMGFSIQIDDVLKHLPQERQTLLFSATLPKNIIALSRKYLKDPVRISVGETHVPHENITQENVKLPESDKFSQLLNQLDNRTGSVIIFVKTRISTEKIAKRLQSHSYDVAAIHGDLRQRQRATVTRGFRAQKYRILVATDIAARGLDIPHIEHVINYDLPQCAEDYIHRIGRTARAGAKGAAVNFISPSDRSKWFAIEKLLNPNATTSHDSERPPRKKNSKRPYNRKFERNSSGGKNANRRKPNNRGDRRSDSKNDNQFKSDDRNDRHSRQGDDNRSNKSGGGSREGFGQSRKRPSRSGKPSRFNRVSSNRSS